MRNGRKIYCFLLAFLAIIIVGSIQSLEVKADDDDWEHIEVPIYDQNEKDLLSNVPVYEYDDDQNITKLPIDMTFHVQDLGIDDMVVHCEDVNSELEKVSEKLGNKTYTVKYPAIYYNKKTKEYEETLGGKSYDGIPVRMLSYKSNIIFQNEEDNNKEVGENEETVKLNDTNNTKIDISNLTPPSGYYIDPNNQTSYKAGESTENTIIKVKPIDLKFQMHVNVNGQKYSFPTSGPTQMYPDTEPGKEDYQSFLDIYNQAVPYIKNSTITSSSLTIKSQSLGDSDPIPLGTTSDDIYNQLFKDVQITPTDEQIGIFNHMWHRSNDMESDIVSMNHCLIEITIECENSSEIKNKVTIKSNLGNVQSEGEYSGKIGDTIKDVVVPEKSGYTADRKNVTATVQADGTILSNEKVTYTKNGTNNSNHHNSNHDNPVVSNLTTTSKLATSDQANVYNDAADKLNETVAKNKTFTTSKKMIKGGQTYYQIEDGKWVSANDAYLYKEVKDYFRTYGNSYKTLLHSNRTLVKNRALAAGSDWYFDRVAEFDGTKYYRVATDEWVDSDVGNTYDPDTTIVNVVKGTKFYDEHGNVSGEFANDITLKLDRVSNINGQKMYRVATNEYVLVK